MNTKSLEDYTVGWICPLEVEQTAALEMLDEEHERLSKPPTDHNVYSLGSIGGHNVVIAGLHQTGNNLAATVVTQMRTTFPNLRFGLLVGIGGGVPVKTDNGMIRLGDIVVSKPAGEHSGAIQYDHGKVETGHFKRIGALAPPPAVLLNAAQDLAAQRARMRKDPIMANIKRIDTKIQGLRKYKFPGATRDYLYRPGYIHLKPGVSCDEGGCDPAQRVQRAINDNDNDDPYVVVHRGTIASGELVIKNSGLRDKLAKQHGILCFEMEAAGTLVDFPCIVIRGISDYCDSHKNDQWHGYAAAAAAAYARQLFFHMPINEVRRYMSSDIEKGIRQLNWRQNEQHHQVIIDWLTSVNYALQQSDFISRRQEGTGEWLLGSDEFQEWLGKNKKTLFCPGMPGFHWLTKSGKTMITSIIVDYLEKRFQHDSSIGIAYIYCNFRQQQQQTPLELLSNLLRQLVQGKSAIPEDVKDLYESHKKKGKRPSLDEIVRLLHSVLASYSMSFILIDALDEHISLDGSRGKLLTILFDLQDKAGANIFATSRFNPDVTKLFKGTLTLEIRATIQDVRKYLDGQISRLPSFVLRSLSLQEEIKTQIAEAVDGMFLLAHLFLDSIIGKKSPKATRIALERLPRGSEVYNDAYEEAMERIESQIPDFRELAKQVLSWITCAKRPLNTSELQHALAVEIGQSELDEENLTDIEDMVSVCAGLVTVDEKSDIIRLVHYTTQEYFEQTQKTWFPNAQKDIAITCITYLSFDTFEIGFCPTDEEFEARLQLYPLYDYTAQNWGQHTRAASMEVEQLTLNLLESDQKVSASSQAMTVSGNYFGYSQKAPRQMIGVHLAAYFGLKEAMAALLQKRYDPNLKDTYGQPPLWWAVQNGHEAVVKLLLERGVELDFNDSKDGRTPLSCAAAKGYEAVVRLLLEYNADVNGRGDFTTTALCLAANSGHEAVVRLLLKHKADINGTMALELAASKGHKTVVQLLLEHNADVNEYHGTTALYSAAEMGHEAVVRLLLEYKANVNSEEFDKDWTALHRAAINGDGVIVQLLLEYGADVNARSDKGWTALHKAVDEGHEGVVRLLLEHNADVNLKHRSGSTALHKAAVNGNEPVVRLLLEHNADVNATWHGRTALQYVVEGLLEHNTDLDATYNGRTMLQYAVDGGNEAVVQLLTKVMKV